MALPVLGVIHDALDVLRHLGPRVPGVAEFDASGRVVYSDQPPTGNVKVEQIQGPSARSNPNAGKELATKEAEFKKRQLDAVEKEKKSDSERADLSWMVDR